MTGEGNVYMAPSPVASAPGELATDIPMDNMTKMLHQIF